MWIDGAAVARLLADERLAAAMMHAALRVLDQWAAEDAVQTTRVALLTSFTVRPRDVEGFMPYAIASTRYESFRMLRASRREAPAVDDLTVADGDDPVEMLRIERVAEALWLAACLEELRAEHRMALLMYAEGMPWAAIAANLGRPEATVRGWLPRTRAGLKACLERHRHG